MSIAIDSMKCRACGKCLDVCPGSLIVRGEDKKAVIRYPKDCFLLLAISAPSFRWSPSAPAR